MDILRAWIAFAVLAICLPIGACNCNNSSGDASDKDAEKATAKGPDEEKAEEEPAEKVPDTLYPDFALHRFEQAERAKIVRVFKAELCPCPDSNVSMHECLQQREGRCPMAEQAAELVGMMVARSYNETDILDKVAELIEASKKEFGFTLDDRPHKGKPGAPVVLVEFADFQCPHCKEASKMMKALHEKYPDDLVIYFKQYPLSAHPFAQVAAQAAIAAHRQGKFWQMHDLLFKHQTTLDLAKVKSFAQQIGLNMQKFEADLQSPEVAAFVAKDRSEGDQTGLTGTPTIFLNGRRYLGELTEDAIAAAIQTTLEETKTTTTETTN